MLTTRKVNAPVPAYTRTAIAAHWLLGALILGQISIGFYVADLPISIERLIWVSRHKALGVTILVLMLLRLGWRLTHSPDRTSVSRQLGKAGFHDQFIGFCTSWSLRLRHPAGSSRPRAD